MTEFDDDGDDDGDLDEEVQTVSLEEFFFNPSAIPTVEPTLKEAISMITARRPRKMLDHIVEHGYVTTQDLRKMGYNDAPRAARDVREHGIPLDSFAVKGRDGKTFAAYRLGDPSKIEGGKLNGRQTFSKEMKEVLAEMRGTRCEACNHQYHLRYLQIDHRVPYQIGGNADRGKLFRFMLLCGSCQRKKSHSCEKCPNWIPREESVCEGCYWTDPAKHTHVATKDIRRVTLTFKGPEIERFDEAAKEHPEGRLSSAIKTAFLKKSSGESKKEPKKTAPTVDLLDLLENL